MSALVVLGFLDPALLLASQFLEVLFNIVHQVLQLLDVLSTVRGMEPKPLQAVVCWWGFGLGLATGGRDDTGFVLKAGIGQVGAVSVPEAGEEAGAAADFGRYVFC